MGYAFFGLAQFLSGKFKEAKLCATCASQFTIKRFAEVEVLGGGEQEEDLWGGGQYK